MSQIAEENITLKLVKPERCRVLYQIIKRGTPIGELALDQIAWRSGEAELKITIYEERHHSQGYGTTAILALLEEAFFRMNLRRIYLRVHASNTIAMRCYKKVGFKKEGRLERCTGGDTREIIYLMGLSKQEFLANGEGEPQAV